MSSKAAAAEARASFQEFRSDTAICADRPRTSCTLASVASHNAAMLLIELIRCARKAFAVSLRAHCSRGWCAESAPGAPTWRRWLARASIAEDRSADQHPIRRLQIANRLPSARNSGLDSTEKLRCCLPWAAAGSPGPPRRCAPARALLHHDRMAGGGLGHRAGASLNPAQVAGLASPKPLGFGGVFTEMNTMSAAAMCSSTAVEK